MQELPHHYAVKASAVADSNVLLESPGLESLTTAGPAEFGGPGDLWSPETLLVAAVADCFILSFRAIARASKMEWISLSCDAVGDLDKIDKVTQFTGFRLRVRLEVPEGLREGKAERLLEKAEKHCLITNSMKAGSTLDYEVIVRDTAA
ncbi:MAG: OsmC family protein [Woeseiaceae bacterium]|nr:OsmC family protein [Woeseiaceae bacterium]